MNLISLLPAMRMMSQMNMNMSPEEMLAQPYFILAMILTLLGLPFLILTLIWMFNALKVSCNLKQWKLWTVALIGIIGGDVLCRFLIGWLAGHRLREPEGEPQLLRLYFRPRIRSLPRPFLRMRAVHRPDDLPVGYLCDPLCAAHHRNHPARLDRDLPEHVGNDRL